MNKINAILTFLFTCIFIQSISAEEFIKKSKLYISLSNNIDSASLFEEYHYYSNGNDSVIINYGNGKGNIIKAFCDPSGRIINGQVLTNDTVVTNLTFDWVTNDSIVYYKESIKLKSTEKTFLKLTNPKPNFHYSESIILFDSTEIIIQKEINKFDTYGNIIQKTYFLYNRSSGLVTDTSIHTWENNYTDSKLMSYVEHREYSKEYFFVEYNKYSVNLKTYKSNFLSNFKQPGLTKFNILGQKSNSIKKSTTYLSFF